MVISKKKVPIKVKLPRRSCRKATKKRFETPKPFIAKKSPKSPIQLIDLPCETLLKIFSNVTLKDLFYNIRPVCKKFRILAMSPILWKTIEVENEIPTGTLKFWIKSAKLLKCFAAKHRNDANAITEEVSKCCRNLESIKLQNCWGSRRNFLLHSTPLCNLVTRCPKLYSFNFSQSRFLSCKFFRLISKDEKNGCTMKKCNYTGPMTPKQMKVLFNALKDYEVHETATIENVNLNNRFKLRDIVRFVQNEQNPNQGIMEMWENINYGPGDNVNELGPVVQQNDFAMDVDI